MNKPDIISLCTEALAMLELIRASRGGDDLDNIISRLRAGIREQGCSFLEDYLADENEVAEARRDQEWAYSLERGVAS